jgi:hypothetical protein
MEALIASLGLVLSAALGLAALAAASIHWGADSRPTIADDHRR